MFTNMQHIYTTLYIYRALPVAVTIRLWDAYLVEGEVYLLRAALGILRLYSSEILAMDGIEEVSV